MASESEWSLNDITCRAGGTGGEQGGAFVPPPIDFGRIRSRPCSIKKPCITDSPRFSDLLPALNCGLIFSLINVIDYLAISACIGNLFSSAVPGFPKCTKDSNHLLLKNPKSKEPKVLEIDN